MSKIPNKKEIEEIVNKSFYDLGYKKKYSKEYYIELVNNTIDNIDWDSKDKTLESEKCTPSYISSLPGNLRSTNPDELQSRLDAIDTKVDEFNEKIEEELEKRDELDKNTATHEENIEYYNKQINDFLKKEKDFEDFNEKLQNEALDSIKNIRDAWYDLRDTNPTNIEPSEMLHMNMNMLGVDEFEFSGVLSGNEARVMKDFANEVENYFSSVSDDMSDWQQQGVNLADEIRALADKHDVNNKSIGWSEKRDEISNTDFIPQMRNNIKESEQRIKENNIESEKITRNIEKYQTAIDNLDENYKKTSNRRKQVME